MPQQPPAPGLSLAELIQAGVSRFLAGRSVFPSNVPTQPASSGEGLAQYAKRNRPLSGQRSLFGADAPGESRKQADEAKGQKRLFDDDGKWITIGGHAAGGAKHAGGTPVKIDEEGNILAGGKWLKEAGVENLTDFGEKESGNGADDFDEFKQGKYIPTWEEMFKKGHRLREPIVGKTGAKIVAYRWLTRTEEGMYGDRAVSDWEAAQTSSPTGRSIVHVFGVELPDGSREFMGRNAAQNAIGIDASRLATIAKNEQARQKQQGEHYDDLSASFEKNGFATIPEASRSWRMANRNASEKQFADTVVLQKDGKFIRTIGQNAEHLKERGWTEANLPSVKPAKPTGPPPEGKVQMVQAKKVVPNPDAPDSPQLGEVSNVDGIWRRAGHWMPTHGGFVGQEAAPRKSKTEKQPQESPRGGDEEKGNRWVREHSAESAEERREEIETRRRWGALIGGPLDRLVGLPDEPQKYKDRGAALDQFREWASDAGPEAISHLVGQLEDRIRQISSLETTKPVSAFSSERREMTPEELKEWAEWHIKDSQRNAKDWSGLTPRLYSRQEKSVPGTHYARELFNTYQRLASDKRHREQYPERMQEITGTSGNKRIEHLEHIDSLLRDAEDVGKTARKATTPPSNPAHAKLLEQPTIQTRGKTFAAKDTLKSLGARWNVDAKSWTFDPSKLTDEQRQELLHSMPRLEQQGVAFYSQGSQTMKPALHPLHASAIETAVYSAVESAVRWILSSNVTPAGEVAQYAKKSKPAPNQKSLFGAINPKGVHDAQGQKRLFEATGTHWITIGGHAEGGKKHAGGTPVEIDGEGNIVTGPQWLKDAGVTSLGQPGRGDGDIGEKLEAKKAEEKGAEAVSGAEAAEGTESTPEQTVGGKRWWEGIGQKKAERDAVEAEEMARQRDPANRVGKIGKLIKLPHQMTAEEFAAEQAAGRLPGTGSHRQAVEAALARGENVPQHVLDSLDSPKAPAPEATAPAADVGGKGASPPSETPAQATARTQLEALQQHLASGKPLYARTMTHHFKLSDPSHLKLTADGTAILHRNRSGWSHTASNTRNDLLTQAGRNDLITGILKDLLGGDINTPDATAANPEQQQQQQPPAADAAASSPAAPGSNYDDLPEGGKAAFEEHVLDALRTKVEGLRKNAKLSGKLRIWQSLSVHPSQGALPDTDLFDRMARSEGVDPETIKATNPEYQALKAELEDYRTYGDQEQPQYSRTAPAAPPADTESPETRDAKNLQGQLNRQNAHFMRQSRDAQQALAHMDRTGERNYGGRSREYWGQSKQQADAMIAAANSRLESVNAQLAPQQPAPAAAAPAALAAAPASQQIANDSVEDDSPEPESWNPAGHLQIAADSPDKLRSSDVGRVLEWSPVQHRAAMADYLMQNRPDLRNEIGEVMSELGGTTPAPTAAPGAAPLAINPFPASGAAAGAKKEPEQAEQPQQAEQPAQQPKGNQPVWTQEAPRRERGGQLGAISGLQAQRTSQRQLGKMDAEADRQMGNVREGLSGYSKGVIDAFERGEINENTPGIHADARTVIQDHKARTSAAGRDNQAADLRKWNNLSPGDLSAGMQVYAGMNEDPLTIAKINANSITVRRPDESQFRVSPADLSRMSWRSRQMAEAAVREGKPIPAEILAQHPDLAERFGGQQPQQQPAPAAPTAPAVSTPAAAAAPQSAMMPIHRDAINQINAYLAKSFDQQYLNVRGRARVAKSQLHGEAPAVQQAVLDQLRASHPEVYEAIRQSPSGSIYAEVKMPPAGEAEGSAQAPNSQASPDLPQYPVPGWWPMQGDGKTPQNLPSTTTAAEGFEPYESESFPGKWEVSFKKGQKLRGGNLFDSKEEANWHSHIQAADLKRREDADAKQQAIRQQEEQQKANRAKAFKDSGLTPQQYAAKARSSGHMQQQVRYNGEVMTRAEMADKQLNAGFVPKSYKIPDHAAQREAMQRASAMALQVRGLPPDHPRQQKYKELLDLAENAHTLGYMMDQGGHGRKLTKTEYDYAVAQMKAGQESQQQAGPAPIAPPVPAPAATPAPAPALTKSAIPATQREAVDRSQRMLMGGTQYVALTPERQQLFDRVMAANSRAEVEAIIGPEATERWYRRRIGGADPVSSIVGAMQWKTGDNATAAQQQAAPSPASDPAPPPAAPTAPVPAAPTPGIAGAQKSLFGGTDQKTGQKSLFNIAKPGGKGKYSLALVHPAAHSARAQTIQSAVVAAVARYSASYQRAPQVAQYARVKPLPGQKSLFGGGGGGGASNEEFERLHPRGEHGLFRLKDEAAGGGGGGATPTAPIPALASAPADTPAPAPADVGNKTPAPAPRLAPSPAPSMQSAPGAAPLAMNPFPAMGGKKKDDSEISEAHRAIGQRFGIPPEAVRSILETPFEELKRRDADSIRLLHHSNDDGPPQFEKYPMGTARIPSYFSTPESARDAYVDFMTEHNPADLITSEHAEGIQQRDPSYPLYVQWAKQGIEPPPIRTAQPVKPGEKIASANRRRVLAAQEAGSKAIKAWHSVNNNETGNPLKYGDILDAAKQPATAAPAPAPASIPSPKPKPPEIGVAGAQKSLFGGQNMKTGQKSLFNVALPSGGGKKKPAPPREPTLKELGVIPIPEPPKQKPSLPGQTSLYSLVGDAVADCVARYARGVVSDPEFEALHPRDYDGRFIEKDAEPGLPGDASQQGQKPQPAKQPTWPKFNRKRDPQQEREMRQFRLDVARKGGAEGVMWKGMRLKFPADQIADDEQEEGKAVWDDIDRAGYPRTQDGRIDWAKAAQGVTSNLELSRDQKLAELNKLAVQRDHYEAWRPIAEDAAEFQPGPVDPNEPRRGPEQPQQSAPATPTRDQQVAEKVRQARAKEHLRDNRPIPADATPFEIQEEEAPDTDRGEEGNRDTGAEDLPEFGPEEPRQGAPEAPEDFLSSVPEAKPAPGPQQPQQPAAEPQQTQQTQQAQQPTGRGTIGPGTASVSDLAVDPNRFQYKLHTNNPAGVTQQFSDATFNPELAGSIHVWEDPDDGKAYVVNGHHRFELAQRSGYDGPLQVYRLKAGNAQEARAKGALINIAGGNGTAVDAAKFMRDTGTTPEEMNATHGVSLKGAVARDAAIMSQLSPGIFRRLTTGIYDEARALAIAKHLPNHEDQDRLDRFVESAEAKGRDISPATVEEMAREAAMAGRQTQTTKSLFGDLEDDKNLFLERATLKGALRRDLSTRLNKFKAVATTRAAKTLEGKNTIDAGANRAEADRLAQFLESFDMETTRRGPVSDRLNQATQELASAPRKQKQILDSLARDLDGLLKSGGAVVPPDDSRSTEGVSGGRGGDPKELEAESPVAKPLPGQRQLLSLNGMVSAAVARYSRLNSPRT